MTKKINDLWTEKYRPKTIEELVVDDKIKKFFEKCKKENKLVGNPLLIGSPGIGKTSLAKMIPVDVIEVEYLYINASDENGIETIRSKVTRFVETKSFNGLKKIVILDEADGITPNAQNALRNLMEQYSGTNSFILTANYGSKITEAVKSRCQSFNISYPTKDYIKTILTILKKEKVKTKGDIVLFIKSHYPDFRKCLNELQKRLDDGVIDLEDDDIKYEQFTEELWENINKLKTYELRKFIINNEHQFDNDYHTLATLLFEHICKIKLPELTKIKLITIVGQTLRNHPHVIVAEHNVFTGITEMRQVLLSQTK